MKFVKKILISCFLLTLLMVSFTGCDDTEYTLYTLQYTDNYGQHTIKTYKNENYSIDKLPYKFGYDFTGLYDAETGGTQYINKDGQSISPFTDCRNMSLYPQFKPKTYTLVFDYQGSENNFETTRNVEYDSILSNLPTNLIKDGYDFVGWFTEPNGIGVQIGNEFGIIESNNKINSTVYNSLIFDGKITLYANFKVSEYNLTLYVGNTPTTIKVKHGTNINDVDIDLSLDGKIPINWTYMDGNPYYIFTGNITNDMTLYALDFASIIEFNSNGGNKISPIIESAGKPISIPTPTRYNYKFIGWFDSNGELFNKTEMPDGKITLTAKWQTLVIFIENGGESVPDLSKNAGEKITLPSCKRDGYTFAGWFYQDTKYISTPIDSLEMPNKSVVLEAGWYKNSSPKNVVIVKANKIESIEVNAEGKLWSAICLELDLNSSILGSLMGTFKGDVSITGYFKSTYGFAFSLYFYNNKSISTSNLITSKYFDRDFHSMKTESHSFNFTTYLEGNKIYCFIKPAQTSKISITDFYIEVTQIDKSTILFY